MAKKTVKKTKKKTASVKTKKQAAGKSAKKAKPSTSKKSAQKSAKKPALKKTAKKKTVKKKKGTTLSAKEKAYLKIREGLVAQKENLLREAEESLNLLPGEINFPDMGDQATAETDRDFMLRLRDRERMLLKKIEEAIERIDNGTFGICDGADCGREIGLKRLEARPVTTYCIDCKTRQEEEEKIAEGK